MKTSGGKEFKVGLERAKFKDFENGTHSKSREAFYFRRVFWCSMGG
jgi:hypothetical protein